MLMIGVGVGMGIAAAQPPVPVVGAIPPDAAIFDRSKVAFFGDVEGVQVWAGPAADTDALLRSHCVVVALPSGTSGLSQCQLRTDPITVSVPTDQSKRALEITVTFPSGNGVPRLTTRSR